ncbi:hypothetical protein AAHE18_05G036800 [Arachis hypogaea]
MNHTTTHSLSLQFHLLLLHVLYLLLQLRICAEQNQNALTKRRRGSSFHE